MSTNNINTKLFNDTDVIKLLKSKQSDSVDSNVDSNVDSVDSNVGSVEVKAKSTRGRKRKYASDEERILARRAQQKAYRERKKLELLELRALKSKLDAESKNSTD